MHIPFREIFLRNVSLGGGETREVLFVSLII